MNPLGRLAAVRVPWVIVAGGFHQFGGMDKANTALAEHLIDEGVPVHLVSHRIDGRLRNHPLVTAHLVERPLGSFFLGQQLLDRRGRRVASAVKTAFPDARILVNGGNCFWPGINWSHYVHHAWNPERARDEPLWLRTKNATNRAVALRREGRAYRQATLILANSDLTRRQILEHGLNSDASRIQTVYLGTDPLWGPSTPHERAQARHSLGIAAERPIAAFVGAIGFDHRKGFNTLFDAWRLLCADSGWNADLLVAGTGGAVATWRSRVEAAGLNGRIRMLGFSVEVRKLLAASDLLVSPIRYEPYGLNVQEALCCGVPAIVSAGAGVAEQYPRDLAMLLLADPSSVHELARKLMLWRDNLEVWRTLVRPLSERLRRYTWSDMAKRIVELALPGQRLLAQPVMPSRLTLPSKETAR